MSSRDDDSFLSLAETASTSTNDTLSSLNSLLAALHLPIHLPTLALATPSLLITLLESILRVRFPEVPPALRSSFARKDRTHVAKFLVQQLTEAGAGGGDAMALVRGERNEVGRCVDRLWELLERAGGEQSSVTASNSVASASVYPEKQEEHRPRPGPPPRPSSSLSSISLQTLTDFRISSPPTSPRRIARSTLDLMRWAYEEKATASDVCYCEPHLNSSSDGHCRCDEEEEGSSTVRPSTLTRKQSLNRLRPPATSLPPPSRSSAPPPRTPRHIKAHSQPIFPTLPHSPHHHHQKPRPKVVRTSFLPLVGDSEIERFEASKSALRSATPQATTTDAKFGLSEPPNWGWIPLDLPAVPIPPPPSSSEEQEGTEDEGFVADDEEVDEYVRALMAEKKRLQEILDRRKPATVAKPMGEKLLADEMRRRLVKEDEVLRTRVSRVRI